MRPMMIWVAEGKALTLSPCLLTRGCGPFKFEQ